MPRTNNTAQQPRWRTLARNGAPDGLSDRQRRAIAALLTADSTAAAARSSGVSRRSLVRWKNDPVFRQALTAASRERFEDAKDLLRGATVEAVQVLRAAQRTGALPERLRAAVAILDLARRTEERFTDNEDWTERTVPCGAIIVGGTEAEYIAALRRLRWSHGDFDPDDPPEEVAAWQTRRVALPEPAAEPDEPT